MGRNLGPLNIKDSYEGLVQISGSQLTDGSGSLISSLDVSVTSATNADSADTATSASHAVSSSYALTASFALNVTPPETGSFMITGSVTDDTLTFTKGDTTTFDLVVDNVVNADSASVITTTDSLGIPNDPHYLTFVDARAGTQQLFTDIDLQYNPAQAQLTVTNLLGTASYAITSETADEVLLTGVNTNQNFGIPIVESTDVGGDTGLKISTNNSLLFNPSTPLFTFDDSTNVIITGDLNVLGNITGSNASFQSASIGYLRTVTGSATIIGDEFIILNADTPTARYAGIKVYDSGSGTPATASLEWDGLSDNWVLVEESGNSGVLLTGPTGSKGAEVLPTVNTIQKGGGHHTLIDSNISDDGSLVTINSNISASGYISASLYKGDGSQLTGIVTDPFPYTGSAEITGSLGVIGDVDFTGDLTGIGKVTIGDTLNVNSGASAMLLSIDSNTTGERSGVFAGYQNTASDVDAVVLGGYGNQASGLRGAVVSGQSNTASHIRSVVVGGISLSTSKPDEVVVNHLSIYGDAIVDNGTTTGDVIDNIGQTAASSEDAVKHIIHLTQAEYDALTPDANTLYVIDGPETLGDTNIDGKLTGTVNTISNSGGTVALDCSVGNYFTLAMPAGGTTELLPSNITAGQTINIEITQNATAATLTYDNTIEFPGGTAFTISTGAGAVDVLTLVSFDGVNLKATGLENFS